MNRDQRITRRPIAYTSAYITNTIFGRNPWGVTWWSAAFPGCGHLMLCKYFTGFMLMGWEFFINIQAHVNEAIFYSMTGRFDAAKHVLDKHWFLLYIGVYVFTMWDSYTLTIELNKFRLLVDQDTVPIEPFKVSALEINYLENRNARHATWWSLFTPGLGYLYINRLPSGFFNLICFVFVTYYSNLLPAVHATLIGDFQAAARSLRPEWFLFLPSLVGFATFDVYIQAKALNQLFKIEQSQHFLNHYQDQKVRIPFGRGT